jgi:hypothetical protein
VKTRARRAAVVTPGMLSMRALAIFECLGTLREPDRIRQLLALQEGVC